jgi:transposase
LTELDRSTSLAAVETLREAGRDVAGSSGLGILNYCRTKVPLGVVEAVNGNIKSLLRRGRGYKNLRYLLLKAQRMAVTKTEFVVFRKAA